MICECCKKNEAEGYNLDDLEVCQSCYASAVDNDYEKIIDAQIEQETNDRVYGKEEDNE